MPQFQYQAKTEPVLVPAGIGWFSPLSQPIFNIKAAFAVALAVSGAVLPPPQVAAATVTGAVPTAWETSPPIVRQFQYQSSVTPLPVTVTEDRWHQPWSVPVRQANRAAYQQAFFWSGVTPVLEDKWHQSWSTPVRLPARPQTALHPAFFWSGFTPTTETITADKWYQQWNNPIIRRDFSVALQWAAFFDPNPIPAAITGSVPIVSWEPSPVVRQFQYQSSTAPVVTPAAPVVVSVAQWAQPLSQPYPPSYVSLDISTEYIAIEVPLESKWHQPWSEPVRSAQRLITGAQQSLFFSPNPIPNVATGAVPVISWEPTPVVRQFQYQSSTVPVLVPPPETVTVDKWYRELSSPVRIAARTAFYQTLFWSGFTPPEVVTVDKWFRLLAEPVRLRSGLLTALQAQISFSPSPIPNVATGAVPVVSWEPVPVVARFQYQVSTQPVTVPPPEVVTLDKWYQQLNQPVRVKLSLSVGSQIAEFLNPLPIPNPPLPPICWYPAWSIPSKLSLSGLLTALQSTTVIPVFPPTPTPPPAGGDFTVSGRDVKDNFPVVGVTYTYAPITKRTN